MLRDSLMRRFLWGCVLSAVFVYVAINYFGADPVDVLDFLLSSFVVIGGMIVLALLGVLVARRLFPRRASFLDDLPESPEDEDIDRDEESPGRVV